MVEAMREIAEQTGELFARLPPEIGKTADLIKEVVTVCSEQSHGVSQIERAMDQLDAVIQHNSMALEEMVSTSTELASQAVALQEAMRYFWVDDEQPSPLYEQVALPEAGELERY